MTNQDTNNWCMKNKIYTKNPYASFNLLYKYEREQEFLHINNILYADGCAYNIPIGMYTLHTKHLLIILLRKSVYFAQVNHH